MVVPGRSGSRVSNRCMSTRKRKGLKDILRSAQLEFLEGATRSLEKHTRGSVVVVLRSLLAMSKALLRLMNATTLMGERLEQSSHQLIMCSSLWQETIQSRN